MKTVKAKKEKVPAEPAFKGKYLYGIGKRKRSVAQVRLYANQTGAIVNNKELKEFWSEGLVELVMKPLVLVGLDKKFAVSLNVHGGGKAGSAIAARLAIARALLCHDEKLRTQMKPQGMLRRDSRKKERKKPGLHKARRGHQFSKR